MNVFGYLLKDLARLVECNLSLFGWLDGLLAMLQQAQNQRIWGACWKQPIRPFSASLAWPASTVVSGHLLLPCLEPVLLSSSSTRCSPTRCSPTRSPPPPPCVAPPRAEPVLLPSPPMAEGTATVLLDPTDANNTNLRPPTNPLLDPATPQRRGESAPLPHAAGRAPPSPHPAGGSRLSLPWKLCSPGGKVLAFRVRHGRRSSPLPRPLRTRPIPPRPPARASPPHHHAASPPPM